MVRVEGSRRRNSLMSSGVTSSGSVSHAVNHPVPNRLDRGSKPLTGFQPIDKKSHGIFANRNFNAGIFAAVGGLIFEGEICAG